MVPHQTGSGNLRKLRRLCACGTVMRERWNTLWACTRLVNFLWNPAASACGDIQAVQLLLQRSLQTIHEAIPHNEEAFLCELLIHAHHCDDRSITDNILGTILSVPDAFPSCCFNSVDVVGHAVSEITHTV